MSSHVGKRPSMVASGTGERLTTATLGVVAGQRGWASGKWAGAKKSIARLEPMTFLKVTRCCTDYFPEDMVQFFSVRLIKSPICNGSTQVYGYIAARDERDGMLNYIVNYSRDDPIVVQQGSLIEMTGPKRCILLDSIVLIEFDMRIKSGRHEEEDLQLIDGAITCSWYTHTPSANTPSPPIIDRITGDSGIVDICLATIMSAMVATIEVVILQVLSGSNLSIGSFLDMFDDYEEIQLFHGKIDQLGALRRFVVAVHWDSIMFLKFEVGNNLQYSQHGCATKWLEFQARQHGCASRRIKLKLTTILVKCFGTMLPVDERPAVNALEGVDIRTLNSTHEPTVRGSKTALLFLRHE
ncbi:hypothetical protein U9M48_025379, partial [Paspalum notatum var. saurae]